MRQTLTSAATLAAATILLLILLGACSSGGDRFRVRGTLDGEALRGLEMVYYDGSAVQRVAVRTDAKGRFEAEGASPGLAIVELRHEDDDTPVAVFLARNGDRLKLEPRSDDAGVPAVVGGSDVSRAFSSMIARLWAMPAPRRNDSIAAYVGANSASPVATALLVYGYDHSRGISAADSLFSLIAPEARPLSLVDGYAELLGAAVAELPGDRLSPMSIVGANDSMMSVVATSSPYTVIVLTGAHRPDSLKRLMRELRAEMPRRRLNITEICLGADSASWRRAIAGDSAEWRQGWLPGGPGAPMLRSLRVTDLPFIIVADSTAAQLYRGQSVTACRRVLSARDSGPSTALSAGLGLGAVGNYSPFAARP